MSFDKDKLRAVPIVEVAKKLNIAIKKSGANFLMQCLWHEDKKPSMILRSSNNRCHCFACGENSDAVGLVMKKLGTDFKGACEWINREVTPLLTPPRRRASPTGRDKVCKIQRLEALQCTSPRGRKGGVEGLGFRYFLPSYVEQHISMASSFAICLRKVFGEEAAAEVVRLYRLGTLPAFDRYDDVMFPLINKHGRILDIKVQAYECDERSDRFFHSFKCYWLGKKANEEAEFAHEALFGEHLLNLYPSKTVVLVESPKNACVGAAVYPQYFWVAAGNKCMLKREVLEVLRGRKVVVYPDNDAFDEWQQKLRSMQDIALFKCEHSHDESEKGDIADYLIKQAMNKSK